MQVKRQRETPPKTAVSYRVFPHPLGKTISKQRAGLPVYNILTFVANALPDYQWAHADILTVAGATEQLGFPISLFPIKRFSQKAYRFAL